MTGFSRVAGKLQSSSALRLTYNLSLRLLRPLRSLLSFLSAGMDDLLAPDDRPFDLDPGSRSRPLLLLYDADDGGFEDNRGESTYLVPYSWWIKTRNNVMEAGGTLYTTTSKEDFAKQILLEMRRENCCKSENDEEGFSGGEFALVPEATWLQTLKSHGDSIGVNDIGTVLSANSQMHDVFPLQIRLSVSQETKSLRARISLMDNPFDYYRKACCIFRPETELLRIWDFSGQTTLFFVDDGNEFAADSPRHSGREILLELQVHGLSNSGNGMQRKEDDTTFADSRMGGTFSSGILRLNGSIDIFQPDGRTCNLSESDGYHRGTGLLGLKGLQNLGNTCFMNSAIQCLVHTPKVVDYFLRDYRKEINSTNPLGMQGELALAFGELSRKLWSPGTNPVAPRAFKSKLAKFAPQFSGYNQHDSQEFLAFLLDGLHEDLNRVKQKPYIEIKDAADRPDEEVAEEYWQSHLAQNDSIIVDVCQGQFRSKLVCPMCKKVSITFDPFMYLTLPLPSTTMRSMTVTVVSTDGVALPSPLAVSVPNCGSLKDLKRALSVACFLRDDETLLVAEVYNNCILRYLEESYDSIDLIRDDDYIVAYRLPKGSETSVLVEFKHERAERDNYSGMAFTRMFGFPLVARLTGLSCGYDVQQAFLKLINPFLKPTEDASYNHDDAEHSVSAYEDSEMEDTQSPCDAESDAEMVDGPNEFEFFLGGSSKLRMSEPVVVSRARRSLEILVFWPEKMFEKYDMCFLGSLPEIFKPPSFTRRPPESVSLYKCLEAFLKEEPLGPEDMWYCPSCKQHQQASKKLDLWRLPEILVVHLKRFSYSQFLKNKLETIVDFPIKDLDLSSYIANRSSSSSCCYVLYAISNHYGGLGGGHYTASVHHGHNLWYEFDDERVFPINEEGIKTSAAYVLFYRRVPAA
ncbi:ubiquitin carboxyl-terminal hydrolase 8-like isoform X2 [Rhodamnia argentea]|uniref:Ubiquitin carboxyl-terminal hydrolase n=1 Tax=Rhodamnia argentea TaxID=178133 RepID=A0A8B8MPQ5_9MYRT|nr:ubiquitin carboxyl-terminal hydrolase 8-like isoform X2 [Rhodamnia argentea]